MTQMSDRELRDRLRAAGRPEPPADLLARLKDEIPEDFTIGGDGLRLAARVERPRVVGIRQITLLAASLLVVVGTGFLAFTVLAPQRSYFDRTAFDQVPEEYVVTVPPKTFTQAAAQPQAMAVQNAPAPVTVMPGTARQPVAAEKMATVTSGEPLADTTAGSRRALLTEETTATIGALGGDNETDTVRAVQKNKAEVAAAAPANAPAAAKPASPRLGAGSSAGEKDLSIENQKTAGSVVATRQEADAARRQPPNGTARTVSESAGRQEADETGTTAAGAELVGRARADAAAPAVANANQTDRVAIVREQKRAATVPGVSLTIVPAGNGHTPAILLRDGQGHPVAAARVTVTASSDGLLVVTHSDRDGLVAMALIAGEYRVEIRTAAAGEPVLAMLHVGPDGWRLTPGVPDRR